MLRNILSELSEATSLPATSAVNRAQLLRYINRAYHEFYSTCDLPGSMFEQTFTIDESQQQISLPWYVEQVRMIRRPLTRTQHTVENFAPRYHSNRWMQPYKSIRFTAQRALHTPLALESQLTVSLAIAQTIPFNVTVSGQTPAAASVTETLTFLPGDLTKTTTNQFAKDDPIGVQSISKSEILTCDLTVRDGSNTLLCTIPSTLSSVRHIILMTNDYASGTYSNSDNQIEVLYKRTFVPVYNDEDEFCTPALESAILWKARAYAYSMAKDELSAQQAILAEQKANDLATQVLNNIAEQTTAIMSLAPLPGDQAAVRHHNPFATRDLSLPFSW